MTILLFAHVLVTTSGYVGLIATNAYALLLFRSRDPQIAWSGLTAWRNSARIFGPLLAVGILLGFALAATSGIPLNSRWLILAYALIVVALGVQAGITIPWQLRSNRTLQAGQLPSTSPLVFVLTMLSLLYTAILWLMVSQPS